MKTKVLFVSMMATLGLIGTGCNQIKENSVPVPSQSRGSYSGDAVAPSPTHLKHPSVSKGNGMGEVTGKRYALVIGNAKYDGDKWTVLDNSVNDATDIKSSLESLRGDKRFTVVSFLTNASYQQMGEAVDKFIQTLQEDSNSVGLFYYAGHGVQIDDRTGSKNYLIPTDFHGLEEAKVKRNALAVDEVLGSMNEAGNQFNIVILDACRQKGGLTRGTRGVGRGGLAPPPSSKGSIVIFPTQPETVAQDGTGGRNGPFTKHLLTSIQEDGHLSLADMLINVRQRVSDATNGEQVPQNYDSTMGKFCFLGCQDVQAQQAQQRAEEAERQAREAQQRAKEAEQALREAQMKIQQVPSAGMGGEANRQIEEANRRAQEAEIAAQRAREEARLAKERAEKSKSNSNSREEMEIPPSF